MATGHGNSSAARHTLLSSLRTLAPPRTRPLSWDIWISGRGRQSRQRVQPAVSPQFRRAHVGFSSIGDAPIYRPQQLAPRGLSGGPTHPASQLLCLPEQLLPSALLRDRPALCCGPPPPLAIDLIDDTNSPVNQRFQHRDENLRVGAGRQRRQGGHQVEQETSAHTRGF